MGPKTYDFYSFLFFKNLINQAMLKMDPSEIMTIEITNQFFIRWRSLIWTTASDIDLWFLPPDEQLSAWEYLSQQL